MHTIHYDNGYGLPACGVLERARVSRNPNDVGCASCEPLIPATVPYQLPTGEVVAIRTDVARGQDVVRYLTMFNGIVDATRYEARR